MITVVNKTETIDLRKIPYFGRTDEVLVLWRKIKPGQSLKIINDHDPKPLYYQFEMQQHGRFEWHNIREGARKWVIKIKKINGGNHG